MKLLYRTTLKNLTKQKMKNLLLVLAFCFTIINISGQTKLPNQQRPVNAAAPIAAGLAVGITGLIAAGIQYEQFIETIEQDATEFYLSNSSHSESFSLKIIPYNITSFQDVSNTNILAFSIIESELNYERAVLNERERKVLFMYLHDGWITTNGLNFSYITTEVFNSDTWTKLYSDYINISITRKFNDPQKISTFQKVTEQIYNSSSEEKFYITDGYNVKHFIKSPLFVSIKGPFITKDDYLYYENGNFSENYLFVSRKIKLDNDEYITKDYDTNTTLVYNEGRLGLYKKDINRLVQLNNKAINEINKFLLQGR